MIYYHGEDIDIDAGEDAAAYLTKQLFRAINDDPGLIDDLMEAYSFKRVDTEDKVTCERCRRNVPYALTEFVDGRFLCEYCRKIMKEDNE